MAKVVIIHDDGKQELVRWVDDNYRKANILFRDDYFATKLWCTEDIETRMEDLGYKVTPERVAAVVAHGGKWWYLKDCTDGEWDCIDEEIEAVCGEPDDIVEDDEEE